MENNNKILMDLYRVYEKSIKKVSKECKIENECKKTNNSLNDIENINPYFSRSSYEIK